MNVDRPALWKLVRHIGVDVLRVVHASDDGEVSLGSPDPVLAVDALVGACSDPTLAEEVRAQGCRVLGASPLELVLPWLVPPLKRGEPWAAQILEIAASAQYSTPTQSLMCIRYMRPDLEETVNCVMRAITTSGGVRDD